MKREGRKKEGVRHLSFASILVASMIHLDVDRAVELEINRVLGILVGRFSPAARKDRQPVERKGRNHQQQQQHEQQQQNRQQT